MVVDVLTWIVKLEKSFSEFQYGFQRQMWPNVCSISTSVRTCDVTSSLNNNKKKKRIVLIFRNCLIEFNVV